MSPAAAMPKPTKNMFWPFCMSFRLPPDDWANAGEEQAKSAAQTIAALIKAPAATKSNDGEAHGEHDGQSESCVTNEHPGGVLQIALCFVHPRERPRLTVEL